MDRSRALETIKEIMDAGQKEMDALFRERTRGRDTLSMTEIEPEMTALMNSKMLLIYEAGYKARQRDEQIERAEKA